MTALRGRLGATLPDGARRRARAALDGLDRRTEPARRAVTDRALRATYGSRSLRVHRATLPALWARQQLRYGLPARHGPPIDALQVEVDPDLPALAWMCRVGPGRARCTVGPAVHVQADAVVEGAWPGDFPDLDFDRSGLLFGSGLRVREGQVVFSPPCHPLECLWSARPAADGEVLVSNSLPMLLAATGIDRLRRAPGQIAAALAANGEVGTRAGIDRYRPRLWANRSWRIDRHLVHPFTVDRRGTPRPHPTMPAAPPGGFDAYREALVEATAAVVANARHPARTIRYEPLTSVSTGYDSSAVAVLAREAGCSEGITIAVEVRGNDDDGRDVGEAVGLDMTAVRHVLGDAVPTLRPELDDDARERFYEFVASGGVGDDVTFAAFEDHLPQRLLLTGAWGDGLWDVHARPTPGLPKNRVMKSLTEFRLRVGFLHLAPIVIGARFPHPVVELSRAPAMAPWSVGGTYDRPISRRICETAGIPRDAFGTRKKATAPLVQGRRRMVRPALLAVTERYASVRPTQGSDPAAGT